MKTVLNIALKICIKPACVWKLAPRCLFGIDYVLFFLGKQLKNVGFYYCVMKPF